MVLISDSMDMLDEVLRTLHTTCSGKGLSISTKKIKILAVCSSCSPTGLQPRSVHLSPDSRPVPLTWEALFPRIAP